MLRMQVCWALTWAPRITPWTPQITLLPEILTRPRLFKKFPEFYGTRRFITAFTTARHMSLSGAISTWSIRPSHFIKIQLNIIITSMPRSFKWSPSLRFPHQSSACTSPLPHTCYMPWTSHSSLFDYPNNTGKEYKAQTYLLCSLLHSPVT